MKDDMLLLCMIYCVMGEGVGTDRCLNVTVYLFTFHKISYISHPSRRNVRGAIL